ncbi:MAG: lipoyl(octanoyl) transferase LipB [Acidobacteria bacterium]|nr:lipoyl(octanoyl) transferase LipB [Acidobacteriota bacterium]
MSWAEAYERQKEFEALRKAQSIPDQLLFVEHPHVVTMGRNGHESNILANPEMLRRAGIAYEQTNRGGDVTYHGPGQIVGYPIFDLREWKRDVLAYIRAVEDVITGTLASIGIPSWRDPSATGVWTSQGKICAIGVHISRWVTTHGFALNHTTDLSYFRYIVPCGLTRPVTSIEAHGVAVSRTELMAEIARRAANIFGHEGVHHQEDLLVLTETK